MFHYRDEVSAHLRNDLVEEVKLKGILFFFAVMRS